MWQCSKFKFKKKVNAALMATKKNNVVRLPSVVRLIFKCTGWHKSVY